MQLPKKFFAIFAAFFISLLLFTTSVHAIKAPEVIPVDDNNNPLQTTTFDENTPKGRITFTSLLANTEFIICGIWNGVVGSECGNDTTVYSDNNGTLVYYVCGTGGRNLKFDIDAQYRGSKGAIDDCHESDFFQVDSSYDFELNNKNNESLYNGRISVVPYIPSITVTSQSFKPEDTLTVTIVGTRRPASRDDRNHYSFDLKRDDNVSRPTKPSDITIRNGSNQGSSTFGPLQKGKYTLKVNGEWDYAKNPLKTFHITIDPAGGNVFTDDFYGPKGDNPCKNGVCDTALGPISTDPTAFVGRILTIALGIAGGIALIIMVYGSIKILTSTGDPKKVGEGREMIVAAVTGLLFLILSVVILRFIGITFLPVNPFG